MTSTFKAGSPRDLIPRERYLLDIMHSYAQAPDGRFLVTKRSVPGHDGGMPRLVVVLNWIDELRRLASAHRVPEPSEPSGPPGVVISSARHRRGKPCDENRDRRRQALRFEVARAIARRRRVLYSAHHVHSFDNAPNHQRAEQAARAMFRESAIQRVSVPAGDATAFAAVRSTAPVTVA